MTELAILVSTLLTFTLVFITLIGALLLWSMIGFMIAEVSFDIDTEDFYELEKDSENVNYMSFQKVPLLFVLATPMYYLLVLFKRYQKVSEKVRYDAMCSWHQDVQKLQYDNNLKSPFYQKTYDKKFKTQRMMNIIKQAQKDVETNSSSAFENDIERKIYQDEYIKAYSLKDDFQNDTKLKYERLYKDKQPSLVSNKEFKEILSLEKTEKYNHESFVPW